MGRVFPGYKNKIVQVERRDGIRVVRILTYVAANRGVLKRTLNYVFYMLAAVVAAPFLGRADIVLSTSPQFFNGLAGFFVSRLKRAPWILEIRDLWPSSIASLGAVETPIWIRLLERLESFVYHKADFVVPLTNAFRSHILARGGSPDAIEVIPNGFDLSGETDIAPPDSLIRSLSLENKFVAAYFGTHGMAHGLETILNAAELLRAHRNIVFLFAGDGAERESLERLCNEKGLSNVLMIGQKPKEMMPVLWAIADVSLVVLRRLEVFKTVVPSKIFEAMAAKVPIILAVEGEAAELLKAARAGVCIKPEDATALADTILELSKRPKQCLEFGQNGLVYVKKYHSRRKFAERYEMIMKKLQN